MKSALTIVHIGYNRFGFKTMEEAIAFFRMAGQSIPLDTHYGKLPDGREGISLIREDGLTLSLEQVSMDSVELEHTLAELRRRAEAKADVEGDTKLVDVSDAPREIEYTDVTASSDTAEEAESGAAIVEEVTTIL